jgi:pimeloyl-ACP methyl ester carboxylesterase
VRPTVTLVLALAGAALVGAAALVVGQRRLLYHPDRQPEDAALGRARALGLEPWRDPSGGLVGWRAPAPRGVRATALVLHGNAGSALDRAHYAEALARRGVAVALLEYPWYGPRPGAPTHASLTRAATDAVDLLAAERAGPPIWLLGESLGSGVAAAAIAARPGVVRGLLLVTPFADLGAVAHDHFPILPASALRDRFRPARDLSRFDGPAVVLVAGRDEVVPPAHGRALYAALRGPKRLVEEPEAGHATVDLSPEAAWWDDAVEFLARGR